MTRSPRILATASNATNTTSAALPPSEALVANVESDFVVILAALLCALICVLGLIAVGRCACLRRAAGGSLPTTTRTAANRGIKKKVLQSLPKFTYTKSDPDTKPSDNSNPNPNPSPNSNKYTTECAICLGEYVEGDEIRALPQCGHMFHVGCIDTWLGSHSSCPSCRQILVVTRCHKCGHCPAAGGGGGGGEMKEGETNCGEGNSNSNYAGFLP